MFNNAQTYSDKWQTCLDRIKSQTSAEEFEKWFRPIEAIAFDGTKLRLRVPNESYVNQIEKNYLSLLRPIILQCYGQQTQHRIRRSRIRSSFRAFRAGSTSTRS